VQLNFLDVSGYSLKDVAATILSFSQKGPQGICILSANGAISNVTIRQPGSSGGLLTYEVLYAGHILFVSFIMTMMTILKKQCSCTLNLP